MATKFTIIETKGHGINVVRWVAGLVGKHTYHAKVYPCGSPFGIHEGNISKLSIRHGATEVAVYDRGWIIHPASKLVTEMVDALAEHYYAESE